MSESIIGRRGRAAALAAGVAALALVVAACGGSGSSSGSSGSSAPPSAGAQAAGQDVITPVTAQNVSCPSGTPGEGKPPIRFGSKNFSEQFVLGELYTQALEARGYDVTYQSNIGGSEVIDRAFQAGQIDAYAEYLGEIESSIAGKPVGATPEDTYNTVKQFEAQNRQATIFKQTPFEDTDVIIVKKDFAQQNGLAAVPDLAKVGNAGDGITLAAQPPFETRQNGLVGMKNEYGLTGIKFTGVDPGLVYQVLDQGQANAADAFSTDGQLATGNYTTLDDPKHIFGFQYVAPVVKQSVADAQGPEFAQTLDCVSSLLTTKVMQALNQEVQLNGGDPAEVAKAFLSQNKVV
ncbi:glycine betaine ABC transporter substrate-binding protein [Pseudonocardia lutea]|uniref:Glycine betaine ABC transporter substrate-binding protein n=1 Tax=Pseudonocardia lutea TaxID=2172015 RepID=A0ABW1I9W4_9PSEU